jgi:hypothetical protein
LIPLVPPYSGPPKDGKYPLQLKPGKYDEHTFQVKAPSIHAFQKAAKNGKRFWHADRSSIMSDCYDFGRLILSVQRE